MILGLFFLLGPHVLMGYGKYPDSLTPMSALHFRVLGIVFGDTPIISTGDTG